MVAFTDDDAFPDRHWLSYLAHAFVSTDHAGIGGPNLAPDDGCLVEKAVARAPGGPIHVLLSDSVAEHVPGCNMAFRRDVLYAVGGFDPQFRVAGDDVDICWRLQERGWTIGFSPAAVVVHKRRRSVRAYLIQQFQYGQAEALLERKWPARYNRGGHLSWAGRIYGGTARVGRNRARVGYGTWGSNLFQSIYDRTPSTLGALPLMPEWYLLLGVLAVLSIVGTFTKRLVPWTEAAPVRVELLLFAVACGALVVSAVRSAWTAKPAERTAASRLRGLTASLFALQPAARLAGRLRYGLTPWRRRGDIRLALPIPRRLQLWSERWRPQSEWLFRLERELREGSMTVTRGGEFDRWDLRVRVGPLAAACVHVALEEHGHGRQLVRFHVWPRWSRLLPAAVALLVVWSIGSTANDPYVALALSASLLFVLIRAAQEAGAGVALVLRAIERQEGDEHESRALFEELLVPARSRHGGGSDSARRVAEAASALEQHG
jgi:hypothetical protein